MKTANRRFFAPQVVQTSAMDCGPAALTCLLGGFGVHVGYGRLREACQTDVDGTSVDALEDIANLLGLEAEQVMMPVDHVTIDAGGALPAVVVTRHPTGLAHFVVAWRHHRRRIQVMDPAVGRRWVKADRFQRDPVRPRLCGAGRRLRRLGRIGRVPAAAHRPDGGVGRERRHRHSARRQTRRGRWEGLAALDAAVRMAAARRGGDGIEDVERLSSREERASIPDRYRFARRGTDGGEVAIRGAIVVRVLGLNPEPPPREELSPELRAALDEPRPRPTRIVLNLLHAVAGAGPAVVAAAAAVAAIGTVGEALLVRGVIEAAGAGGRISVAALLALAVALLALEAWLASAALGLGRRMESHLRQALLHRLPRLPDPYFRSRPVSDLGERAHRLHLLRQFPPLGVELVRAATEVVALTVAIAWVNPGSAVPAVPAAVVAVGAALAIQPALVERDLRLRNHSGATARFYLDGLLALVALQAHAAEAVVEAEHGRLLDEWRSAARSVARTVVTAEAVQGVVGVALAVWLVAGARGRATDPATFLLIAYWALSLPVLGQRIAVLARQYPSYRNTTLRFLEPLSSPEEPVPEAVVPAPPAGGAEITMEGVTVVAGGHAVLSGVDFELPAGSRVAVVGSSGAGKSSLVGLLLGWHRPAEGRLLVDGEPLDGAGLARLRRHTVWVDPAVTVWNRSLADNLTYGTSGAAADLDAAIEDADLGPVVARLPAGVHEALGEDGGLLSGGEAQRVRLGRARTRTDVRLAVLDEPFRGLDRGQRRTLLGRARTWWPGATLLLVTHDVGETLEFDRVIVVQGGAVVEDGRPHDLAAHPGSRYAALLRAEDEAAAAFADPAWRRCHLVNGTLDTAPAPA